MKYRIAAIVLLCIAPGVGAHATTVTGSFQVQITIQATCTLVSATNLNFGTNGVLAANIDQTNTITVQCTNTTPYDIGLNKGLNGAAVTTRQMKGGPSNELINYAIFRDSARTQNWGETIGTDTVTGTGNGAAQSFTAYGRVAPQTTPTPGSYTDTITVTVTY